MSGHKKLSVSERAAGTTCDYYLVGDDIELPPNPSKQVTSFAGEVGGSSNRTEKPQSNSGKWIGVTALAAAIAIGGWSMFNGSSAERQHENWQHVSAATEASQSGTSVMTHIDATGTAVAAQTIEVSRADRDFVTTAAVRQALFANDVTAATNALQNAQNLPLSNDPDFKKPTIEPGSQLEYAIKRNRDEFFKVHVFDCCDEDGDVVEILVNGNSFAIVPLTHKGMTLSIPLQRGSNTLTLRGVKDGQGGITVSFATSQGNYYCRGMRVGEEYTMGVVNR